METFELRYFLEVAHVENIHRASERAHVSPGSLSKAITRIENELGTKLFVREGRNIRLTDHGRILKLRASQILQLEESTRLEIAGHEGEIKIVIAGPEVLLSKAGLLLSDKLKSRYKRAIFEFTACDEKRAQEKVSFGEAHLAIVTEDVSRGLSHKSFGEAKFLTVVGPGHPLYAAARAKRTVAVEDVLKHGFVSPSRPILGQVGLKQSLDGWRDDKFARKVDYLTESLRMMQSLLETGKSVGYVPDYFAEQIKVLPLKVSGCPYSCSQKIRLIAKRPHESAWQSWLFSGSF